MRSSVVALIIAALAVFTSAAPVALPENLDGGESIINLFNAIATKLVQANVGSVLGDVGSGIDRRDVDTIKSELGDFTSKYNIGNL